MKSSVGERITNSIISGVGLLLTITFMVIFILKSNTPSEKVFYSIYTSIIIIHYLFKILYYSLNETVAKNIMKVLNRSYLTLIIYFLLLIINLIYVKGIMGWLIFSLFIPVSILGIIFNSIFNKKTSYIWIIMNFLLSLGSLSVLKYIIINKLFISFISLGIIIFLGTTSFILSRLNNKAINVVSNILSIMTITGVNLFLYLYLI